MEILEKIKGFTENKKSAVSVVILGIAGIFLLFLSNLGDRENAPEKSAENTSDYMAQDYCRENEERLEAFLKNIEGAGEVKVYLKVGSGERYIYASEGKYSKSENKTEEEEKYVIVGGSSNREALVETVEVPQITGAVVVCKGCTSAVVEERIYKATSKALDIPTSDIYVTIMK